MMRVGTNEETTQGWGLATASVPGTAALYPWCWRQLQLPSRGRSMCVPGCLAVHSPPCCELDICTLVDIGSAYQIELRAT